MRFGLNGGIKDHFANIVSKLFRGSIFCPSNSWHLMGSKMAGWWCFARGFQKAACQGCKMCLTAGRWRHFCKDTPRRRGSDGRFQTAGAGRRLPRSQCQLRRPLWHLGHWKIGLHCRCCPRSGRPNSDHLFSWTVALFLGVGELKDKTYAYYT